MQKTLAATAIAAFVGVAGQAYAADVYAPGGFKDGPVPVFPAWAGFYAGGHVGGAWGTSDVTDVNLTPNVTFSNNASGVFGGGQFGYLYQLGNVVIGPEVDLGEMSLSHTATEPGANPNGVSSKIDSGFYADITGRLGYGFGPAFIYAKGGYAYYGGDLTISEAGVGSTQTSGRGGFTAGGGVEYKFNPAWSVKAEYQYFDFSRQNNQLTINADGNNYNYDLSVQTFKVGINYHFCVLCQAPLK